MKVALIDEQLTIAGPNAQGDAACPDCEGIVRLHWNRQGTYYWRHKRPSRGGCPASLEKLLVLAQKYGGRVVELPAEETLTLNGPGIVILLEPRGEMS